jgi:acetyltransferase EpsM
MTPQPLILVGGGEHARVVAEAARSTGGWEIVGVADPAGADGTFAKLGIAHLGDDIALAALLASAGVDAHPWLIVSIGAIVDGAVRQDVVARFERERWACIVHAAAWVSPTAEVEPGAVVMAGAVVNAGARIGAHAIVNTGAIIEHDVVVGAFTRIGPRAVVGGGTVIGADALIGLGAAVRDHVSVGAGATVGMGAVVTKAVAPGATVVGVPARGATVPRATRDVS